jgi:hypothetical protein
MRKAPVIATSAFFLSLLIIIGMVVMSPRSSETRAPEADSYSTSDTPMNLPPGPWSLICSPARETGEIADLYSVTSTKSDTITKVGIKNRSNKTVIAVKLGWRLVYNHNPSENIYYNQPSKNILMSGESPFLGVPLKVKEALEVEFPLVSFAKISKSLVNNGTLDGDFRIVVIVTDVLFSDDEGNTSNSSWRSSSITNSFLSAIGYGPNYAIVKVASYPDVGPLPLEECQNQECKLSSGCYKCEALDLNSCSTSSCDSCTERKCS